MASTPNRSAGGPGQPAPRRTDERRFPSGVVTGRMTPPPILVAVAWPYANGPLHLGHVAGSLLPPDIFARYHRLRGRRVAMVSGSDMHGTPIMVAAEKAGEPPEAFAARNHELHKDAIRALAIHFDLFTSTATANHREVVHEIFDELRRAGYIEKRSMTAPFDPKARRFLPDRYVEGTCPHCGAPDARGDQCDTCGRTLDPHELKNPRSKLTNERPEWRETEHFFLLLSKIQPSLAQWVAGQSEAGAWRPTVRNFTNQWLSDGLKDRAITRDLTYGVPLPASVGSFPDKRIYVWFEAVVGYLSATREWAQRMGEPSLWREFWTANGPATSAGSARSFYFLGKDNIPFHTIIWPGMLVGANETREREGLFPRLLPWDVPANEFLQFRGAKFSKSRGNAFYVLDLLHTFEPDQVRYYLAANMPEKGDTDWTWEDFVAKVNDELVGTLGNYVNRVLAFCDRNFAGIPPAVGEEEAWAEFEAPFLAPAYDRFVEAAEFLEVAEFKKALKSLIAVAQLGNQAIDSMAPWALVKEGPEGKSRAAAGLRAHLAVIRDLGTALAPFLPHAAASIWAELGDAGVGTNPRAASEVAQIGRDHWPREPRALRLPAKGKLGAVRPVFGKLELSEVLSMFGPNEAEPKSTPAGAKPALVPDATRSPPAGRSESGERASAPASASSASASGGKATEAGATAATPGLLDIAEFQRMLLRVGVVRSVEDHPKADKLYVLRVDLGNEIRQIVAGLREKIPRERLLGARVVVVANLKPAVLRGVESQGMLLAAEDATGTVVPLTTAGDIQPGAKIR